MAITGITNNYDRYSDYMNTTEETTKTATSQNNADTGNKSSLLRQLQEKYSDFNISAGTFSQNQISSQSKGFQGVTISSAYLSKAGADEETAKKLDEMLSGVEDAYNWLKNAFKSEGLELVSCGYYIDENGNMGSWSVVEKKDSIFDGLIKQNEEAADRIKEKKEKDKEQKKIEEKKAEKKEQQEKREQQLKSVKDKVMVTASTDKEMVQKAKYALQGTDEKVKTKDEKALGNRIDYSI